MDLIMKYIFGVIALIAAFPIGDYLARITREELKEGKKWFKLIIFLSIIGIIVGIVVMRLEIIFWCCFVMIVASRSAKK